ncbi:MEG10-like protein, partial [Mya arenaria]
MEYICKNKIMLFVLWGISFLCLVLRVAGVPGTICTVDRDGIGRFGPGCKLPCFCADRGECDQTSGTCKAGCAPGMFGPSCQYRDIAHDQMKNARHSEPYYRYAYLAVDDDPITCSSTDVANSRRTKPPWWRIWFPYRVNFTYIEITIKETMLRYTSNFTVSVTNMSEHQNTITTFWPSEEHLCYLGDGFDIETDNDYAIIKLFCRSLSLGNTIKITLGSVNSQLELCDVNIKQGGSIAHGKPTLSSTAKQGNAGNVVDGSHVNRKKSCFISKKQSNPWWQVDLGGVSSIRELRLTPFHKGPFSGYKVNISTHENYSFWKTVYNDSGSGQKYVQVTFAARHIRIYRPGKTKLSLCEVEVYEVCGYRRWGDACGKECYCGGEAPCDMYTACVNNTFGPNCSNKCNEHCTGLCDSVKGTCTMCSPGYKGQFCNEVCSKNKWGMNCNKTCGQCATKGCNSYNGFCPTGCQAGYQLNTCDEPCDNRSFGVNCSGRCNSNCKGPCNKTNGLCLDCKSGLNGSKCERECPDGYYGPRCIHGCGYCLNGSCDRVSGNCSEGCKPGYKQTSQCLKKCRNGTFGLNCSQNCSEHCERTCDRGDGHCSCQRGYQLPMCINECEPGTWGKNCSQMCGGCHAENCSRITGHCLSGCKPGYKISSDCIGKCDAGSYGNNCSKSCSINCEDPTSCNTTTGFCGSCKRGWQGTMCSERCPDQRYGQNCQEKCGHCAGATCNIMDGHCISCIPGYKNDGLCKTGCEAGSHGVDCQERCGMCAGNKSCHPENGTCPLGCKTGFSGDGCTQKLQASPEPLTVAIVGAVGGGVLIITIIAITVVVLLMKRQIPHPGTSKAQTKSSDYPEESGNKQRKVYFQDQPLPVAPPDDPVVVLEPTYANMNGEEGQSPRNPVNLSQLLSYIVTKSADQTYFSTEYTKIPTGMTHPATAARDPENAGKSRYKNLYAYDHSRVLLKKQQGGTDYINACFIQVQYGLYRHLFHSGTVRTVSTLVSFRYSTDCIDTCLIQVQYGLYRHLFHSGTVRTVSTLVPFRYRTCLFRHLFYSGTERPVSTLIPFRYITDCIETGSIYVQYGLYRHLFHSGTVQTVSTLVPFSYNTDCIDNCSIQLQYGLYRNLFHSGYSGRPEFIASQGPMKAMIEDFIRMIWENSVITVVMVTNPVELGKIKCLPYWREMNEEKEIGMFVVELTAEQENSDFAVQYGLYRQLFHSVTVRTVSTLVPFRYSTDCIDTCSIQTNPDVARSVRQFHYTAWPDKDVPDSPASLLMFWHTVRAYDPQRVAPWLVHCSAGVGRTGTFIAMDILHSQGNKTGVIDVFQCVHTLRDQRVNMVQTLSQYKFLHEVMYEALVLSSWPVPVDEFPNEHQRLVKVDPVLNKTNILLEYETLFERYAFVVSQTPLEETLVDFCRLIHDLDIRIVVSFPDEGREQVGKLPTSGSSTIGPFTVRFEKEKTSDSIIHRKY